MFDVLQEVSYLWHEHHSFGILGDLEWGGIGVERKPSLFFSWSVSIKKVCILSVCRWSQMCPFHKSFWLSYQQHWHHNIQVLVPKSPQPSPLIIGWFQITLMACSHPAGGWWDCGSPPQSQGAAAHPGEPMSAWWTSGCLFCSFPGLGVTSPPS